MKKRAFRYFGVLFLLLLVCALSFWVYRNTDEKESERARDLFAMSEGRPVVWASLGQLSDPPEDWEKPICYGKNQSGQKEKFVQQYIIWEQNNKGRLDHFLNEYTKTPPRFDASSMAGYQEGLKLFKEATALFEIVVCYFDLTRQTPRLVKLFTDLSESLIQSLQFPQPLDYSVLAVDLLTSALHELQKFDSGFKNKSGLEELGFDELYQRSQEFHAHSIFQSYERLKNQGWTDLKIWLPVMMIQPVRFKNQLSQVLFNESFQSPSTQSSWYDVENMERIYLQLYRNFLIGKESLLRKNCERLKSYVSGPMSL